MNDEWETPGWLFNQLDAVFEFDLDLCASDHNTKINSGLARQYFTKKDSSLDKVWLNYGNSGFMNPPYSNPKPFVEKAIEEAQARFLTVALLPADTSTQSFQLVKDFADTFYFIPHRLSFELGGKPQGPARFASMIAIFGMWPKRP